MVQGHSGFRGCFGFGFGYVIPAISLGFRGSRMTCQLAQYMLGMAGDSHSLNICRCGQQLQPQYRGLNN